MRITEFFRLMSIDSFYSEKTLGALTLLYGSCDYLPTELEPRCAPTISDDTAYWLLCGGFDRSLIAERGS